MIGINYKFLENLFQNQLDFFISPLGVIAFILVYILWVNLFLPSSWLTMLGGLLYGSILGSLYVFIAASLGAILTFILGRTFLQTIFQKRLSLFPKLELIERSISNEGLKLIILTRLSPIFPFGILNIAYSLSNVRSRDFLIGLLAISPGTFLYCSLGSLAKNIYNFDEIILGQDHSYSFALTFVGFLATLILLLIISRAAKKSLENIN